jgi:hypothetical protein
MRGYRVIFSSPDTKDRSIVTWNQTDAGEVSAVTVWDDLYRGEVSGRPEKATTRLGTVADDLKLGSLVTLRATDVTGENGTRGDRNGRVASPGEARLAAGRHLTAVAVLPSRETGTSPEALRLTALAVAAASLGPNVQYSALIEDRQHFVDSQAAAHARLTAPATTCGR